MIFLYVAILGTALYYVSKILLPEMAKPPLPRSVPQPKSFDAASPSNTPENRMQKLEILLAEKNKNISLLQTELKIFYTQVREFDKVKSLLEEEIHRLREQNRIFRSELGLPTTQLKENSERLFI